MKKVSCLYTSQKLDFDAASENRDDMGVGWGVVMLYLSQKASHKERSTDIIK